jgi:hypothetical protein
LKKFVGFLFLFLATWANAQFVSSVSSTPSANSATVTFTTPVQTTAKVAYGTTTQYGSVTALDGTLSSSHSISLSSLAAGTTYHYYVQAWDSLGEATSSIDYQFTTLPISVSVSPSTATLTANGTQQFSATVTGSTQGVTWSVTGGGTVSTTGLYTAPASVTTQFIATVKATSVENTTKSETAAVTVNPTVTVSASPNNFVISSGLTQQFTATVTGAANTNVTWSTSAGTISSAGLFTTPAVTADTTVTVTASSVQDPTKSATVSGTVLAPAPPPTGLVAGFNFEEGTGTTTTDVSSNHIVGTLNGATWVSNGHSGKALSFDGAASFVDLGRPTPLLITGSMTVEAWVYATGNPPDDGNIVSLTDSSGRGWQIKTSPDTGQHTFGFKVTGASDGQLYSNTVRALNAWYHVAAVYDSTSLTMKIYVNGVLDNGTFLGTVPGSQSLPAGINVNIGRRSNGYYFKGLIDDVRIYNRALSLSEVQTDMNTAVPGGNPPPPPQMHTVSLSWNASTSVVAGYNVYRSTTSGTGYTKLNTSLVPALSYFDDNVATGTYYYVTTAVDDIGLESSFSNQVAVVVP